MKKRLVLPFKERFIPSILDGSKRTTIRCRRKHMPNLDWIVVGSKNMRTKEQEVIFEYPIIKLELAYFYHGVIMINGEDSEEIAIADGFERAKELGDFLQDLYGEEIVKTPDMFYRITWDYDGRIMCVAKRTIKVKGCKDRVDYYQWNGGFTTDIDDAAHYVEDKEEHAITLVDYLERMNDKKGIYYEVVKVKIKEREE